MGKYPGGPSGQGKAGNWLSPPSSACPGPKPSASLLSRRMPGSLLASRARGQRRGGGGGTWHGANGTWLALGGRGLAGPPPTHAPADPWPGFSCFCPGCGHKNGVPVLPLPPPPHMLFGKAQQRSCPPGAARSPAWSWRELWVHARTYTAMGMGGGWLLRTFRAPWGQSRGC